MINDIFKLVEFASVFIPKEWQNIKVNFSVEELGLHFVCDDKSIGYFRVSIYNTKGELVAYLEGENSHETTPIIGHNQNKFSPIFLKYCFHIARCRREFERTNNMDYMKGFSYYRSQAIKEFNLNLGV